MGLMTVGVPNNPQNPACTAGPGPGSGDPLDEEPGEDWVADPKTPEEAWRGVTGLAEGEGDEIDDEIASLAAEILSGAASPEHALD